ncbi:TSUP family transporter [Alsobacter sp. SYSU BS001988]
MPFAGWDPQGWFATLALAPATLAWAGGAVFLAALLRGFTGFGFALAAVPMLGMTMAPAQAVPVALGLQLLGGLVDLRKASQECHWPSLRWLSLGAALGSPVGVLTLHAISAPAARIAIGLITMGAVVVLGRGFALAAMPGRLVTATAGLLAGLFNGVAAMPGPPAVAYYMSAPIQRAAARASLLVFFLATSMLAIASAAAIGLFDRQSARLAVAGLPVMVLGTWLGQKAFRRSTASLHRWASVVSLGLIALVSIGKGLAELASR